MASIQALNGLIQDPSLTEEMKNIVQKVKSGERISTDDALYLYENAELHTVGILANYIREEKNGDKTYFNKNFHIEPTNVCVYSCSFCAYSRLIKNREDGWELTLEEMMDIVRKYDDQPVTEVHFTGGVLPQYDVPFYEELFRRIKKHRPELHIKGLTPVEYHYIFKKEKLSYQEGMERMRAAGLDSMPGGGAEIFDKEIRDKIAGGKCSTQQWLDIHEIWHKMGMKSNATMLYGHIETFAHRVHHLQLLRELQDKTGGFMAFIPLKFRNKNNQMSHVPEVSTVEDLRNYAISRIFLDNFRHIKAYWPMIGRDVAQMSLAFGVNDIDGTIDDTTKIYTMAGAEEQSPSMTTAEIVNTIRLVGRQPIERDTLYNPIKDYTDEVFAEDTQYRGYAIK
ncbi:MAG TPA: aminofutalosine synthase MqnE [Saprospiraceae bacterium]|nr:aminofutalosine synthase MqnE [Saprospiraceae bacterium]